MAFPQEVRNGSPRRVRSAPSQTTHVALAVGIAAAMTAAMALPAYAAPGGAASEPSTVLTAGEAAIKTPSQVAAARPRVRLERPGFPFHKSWLPIDGKVTNLPESARLGSRAYLQFKTESGWVDMGISPIDADGEFKVTAFIAQTGNNSFRVVVRSADGQFPDAFSTVMNLLAVQWLPLSAVGATPVDEDDRVTVDGSTVKFGRLGSRAAVSLERYCTHVSVRANTDGNPALSGMSQFLITTPDESEYVAGLSMRNGQERSGIYPIYGTPELWLYGRASRTAQSLTAKIGFICPVFDGDDTSRKGQGAIAKQVNALPAAVLNMRSKHRTGGA